MARFMFSKKCGLMCEVQPSGNYYVINGNWTGIRRGDEFDVIRNDQVINTITVTDWKEQATSHWPNDDIG